MPELMKSSFIWIFLQLNCISAQPLSITWVLGNLLAHEPVLYYSPRLSSYKIPLLAEHPL